MKRITRFVQGIALMALAFTGNLCAQVVQYGQVVEMNSGGKELSGVSVTLPAIHDCQPTMSDKKGIFKLNFSEHQVGDVVHGLRFKKAGYEVVNNHIVRQGWTLTDKDSLRVVMAPQGKIAEARARYYDLLETSCVERYDTTMFFLNQQLAQGYITESEFQYWKSEADAELDDAYRNMEDFADRLARVNEEDRDELSVNLRNKLKENDMDGAFALMSGSNFVPVLQAYNGISGHRMILNEEENVANEFKETIFLPDSLTSKVAILQAYTRFYEGDFVDNGLRYAKSCLYMGLIYKNLDKNDLAGSYFDKALHMFELIDKIDSQDYQNKIDKIKALIETLK